MAKVTITIEDRPDGTVKVEATPNFQTMMAMDMSGSQITAAHGYAFRALNAIQEAAKAQEPLVRKIPRIIT